VANVPPQGGRKHPQQEYLQGHTNILFICGGVRGAGEDRPGWGRGAARRVWRAAAGRKDRKLSELAQRTPTLRTCSATGWIPELVGRLPVAAVLHELEREAAGPHPQRNPGIPASPVTRSSSTSSR